MNIQQVAESFMPRESNGGKVIENSESKKQTEGRSRRR
jgi:hypothetical protein